MGIAAIWNSFKNLWVRNEKKPFDEVPDRDYIKAIKNPYFRQKIIECSIQEDEENSYYTGILNTIAEHTCGSMPLILGNHPEKEVNDTIEDKWLEWGINNQIGMAIRQIRRSAARTGLGIGLPYKKNDGLDAVTLGIKTLCATDLRQPRGATQTDKIIDGVEYDENWDIKKIYVYNGTSDPEPYDVKDIIIWSKQVREGFNVWGPECGPAFTIFPSVRRFMKAIVRGEEFKASIPMALTLDPNVYKPDSGMGTPKGTFEYEPGMVPTLPPGVKLEGLQLGQHGAERIQFIELVISAAARCVQMPKNIALGDSSGHNMATAAIDILPWKNRTHIDRRDFEPVTRKIFKWWMDQAVLTEGYFQPRVRAQAKNFRYNLNYDMIFQHPDPKKNADARAVDLISGASTLSRIFTDQGLNARRELERDAKLLGITIEELYKIILAARNTSALQVIGVNDGEDKQ